ncbi:MAG: calcium-binding protein, partial [Rhodospirillales bacterium]|nr:calcium-binding protein [Rhodospirillales bacterium]
MATFSGTSDSDVIRPNQISDGVYADPAGSTPSNGVFDIIYGNDGYDTLDGGAGPDEIYGGEGPDRIEDNSYYNAFSPTEPNSGNKIHGNGGDDQITLWVPAVLESDNTAENIVYGGEGNDATNLDVILEEGAEGSNPLTGITTIFGGSGDDRVQGYTKSGSQTVDLSHAETRIYGEEGDDQLEASRLFTEELVGGGNREILYGGAGSDVYRVYEAIDTVVELEGEGTDEVIPYNMNYSLTDHVENMFVVYPSYSDNIIMSPFYQGNGLDNTMWGCELNETLCGAAGNDTIYGKWTGTHQAGTVDADVIHGGDGNDTLYGGGGPGETWDGNDTLYGDLGADTISGQDGNDQIYGGRSADDPADGPDTIYADVGNDNVWAGGG